MTDLICQIERFDRSTYEYVRVFKALGGHVRIDPPRDNYHAPPAALFRFYPRERVGDMENDQCMIVCCDDILHPEVNASLYPEIRITGHLNALLASHQVMPDPHMDGRTYAYTPERMSDFKSGSVRIRVWPVGHYLGDDEFVKEFDEKYGEPVELASEDS